MASNEGEYVSLFLGRYSFRAHRCEWKIGPDDSAFIITLFLCRVLSDVFYEDYTTVDVDYCGGYVPLFVRHIFFQSSQMWVKYWPRWFSLYHNIVSVKVSIRCLLWKLYDSRCRLLWWICSTVCEADILSDLTDVSERLAQINQYIS